MLTAAMLERSVLWSRKALLRPRPKRRLLQGSPDGARLIKLILAGTMLFATALPALAHPFEHRRARVDLFTNGPEKPGVLGKKRIPRDVIDLDDLPDLDEDLSAPTHPKHQQTGRAALPFSKP
jgi:hypothetical protein